MELALIDRFNEKIFKYKKIKTQFSGKSVLFGLPFLTFRQLEWKIIRRKTEIEKRKPIVAQGIDVYKRQVTDNSSSLHVKGDYRICLRYSLYRGLPMLYLP